MRSSVLLLVAVTLGSPSIVPAGTPIDCEPARCAAQAAINAQCPCDGATNHGRHVSCVAHVIKSLVGTTVPVNCKGKIVRCAARSTCGKDGFVTCQLPVLDTCDLGTGTCTRNPLTLCTTDVQCTTTRCKIAKEASCAIRGGTQGTSSTCCASCGS